MNYKIGDKTISREDMEPIVDNLVETGCGKWYWTDLDDADRDWFLNKMAQVCNNILGKSK
jgi:hypothetical protein